MLRRSNACLRLVTGLGVTLAASLPVCVCFAADASASHETRNLSGWSVHVSVELLERDKPVLARALEILDGQLNEMVEILPPQVVAELRKVPLYFSPPYPGTQPKAEYHSNRDWLVENGRNPEMAKSVEFTNVAIFEQEASRMPSLALHELAHAWHDRILPMGYANPKVREAHERARQAGLYEKVERRHGDGRPNTVEKAYAMQTPMEFFAETSEAFFGTNDFFPFQHAELKRHDPETFGLLVELWRLPRKEVAEVVSPPPAEWKAPPFYSHGIAVDGYPIVASATVNPYALREAAWIVGQMLAHRPDVRNAMIRSGSRLCILAHNEFTTELPEFARFVAPSDFSDLSHQEYWDARTRGTGGSRWDAYCSCGEENLLAYPGDPYHDESILIHEFAHAIHWRGLLRVEPDFDEKLHNAYKEALGRGLWRGTYAGTNYSEYFAEGVQSWFDDNRQNDREHNHVNTRRELIEYDPGLAAVIEEVFGETRIHYTKPTRRLYGHLDGYDPDGAPTFQWPKRLDRARARIAEKPFVLEPEEEEGAD